MASKGYSNLVWFIFLSVVLIILLINEIPNQLYLNMAGFIHEFKEIESSYETMSENFSMIQYYEGRKKDLLIKFESMNYNYNLFQEEIITLINEHCLGNNIIMGNIAFINDDERVYNHNEHDENSPLKVMKVTIEFKCSYDNLLFFIDDLKNDTVEIAVVNMRVINWNNGVVNVVTDLNFYSIDNEVLA